MLSSDDRKTYQEAGTTRVVNNEVQLYDTSTSSSQVPGFLTGTWKSQKWLCWWVIGARHVRGAHSGNSLQNWTWERRLQNIWLVSSSVVQEKTSGRATFLTCWEKWFTGSLASRCSENISLIVACSCSWLLILNNAIHMALIGSIFHEMSFLLSFANIFFAEHQLYMLQDPRVPSLLIHYWFSVCSMNQCWSNLKANYTRLRARTGEYGEGLKAIVKACFARGAFSTKLDTGKPSIGCNCYSLPCQL